VHGAVAWVPGAGGELVEAVISAASTAELLGKVASRLADPRAALWPPFAIVVARGADLVVVVHGPVEVTLSQDGAAGARLYGGDDVGSWLNRIVHNVSSLSAGKPVSEEGPADLREGVIRADGFKLTGAEDFSANGAADVELRSQANSGRRHEVAGDDNGLGLVAVAAPESPESGLFDEDGPEEAESPTVAEPAIDVTVAEQSSVQSLGRLTWDNGEVHQLTGDLLIGRDVLSDPAVIAGELLPLVPSGQNDSMSRVHAELRPRGKELVVIDRGSTNGTFVWDDPSRAWQRLVAGQPVTVPAGGVLAFGERTATFEAVAAPVG